jgi:hypothetical protein
MYNVLQDLKQLYTDHGITTDERYDESMSRAMGPQLAYGSPAMYGVTATVLSSRRMIAYNLAQNAIDEAKGAARIQVIADSYAEGDLYKKMHRHVGEELKHSRQFKALVPATGYRTKDDPVEPEATEEVLDFGDELRAFICRVHSIEIRSWTVLRMYQHILCQKAFPDLSEAALPVLDDIMRDEINHVIYTGQQIDEWLRDDEGLQSVFDECLDHTNRETWQDIASMTAWMAKNYRVVLEDGDVADASAVEMPESRFLVGDLTPPATLT